MDKKIFVTVAILAGFVCHVCAQEEIKVSGLDVVNKNNVNVVNLNQNGNVTALGLYLHKGSTSSYGTRLSFYNINDSLWSITSEHISRGPIEKRNLLLSADTVFVSDYLRTGNSLNVENNLKVKNAVQAGGMEIVNEGGSPMVSLTDDGNMTALGLVLHKGSANTDNSYYGPNFSIKCNDYKTWDILANARNLGYIDTLNVKFTADTVMFDKDLIVGNSFKVGSGMQACNIAKDGRISTGGSLTLYSVAGTYFPRYIVNMEDGAWTVSTKYSTSYGDSFNPMKFDASDYTFKNGNMIVEGTITCKDSLKVAEVKTDNLRAKNVTVDMGDAADYVFDENYDLKPLGEVEAYVKANKHLPGIPSASQMKEEGMNVSEMSNLLLEKIEELTLHVIRLEKENQELKSEMKAMKNGK